MLLLWMTKLNTQRHGENSIREFVFGGNCKAKAVVKIHEVATDVNEQRKRETTPSYGSQCVKLGRNAYNILVIPLEDGDKEPSL